MPDTRRVRRIIRRKEKASHRNWLTVHQRNMLGLTVMSYQLGLMALAGLPLAELALPGLITLLGGGVVCLGIASHVSPYVALPGDRWVYLGCALLDFYVFAWFLTISSGDGYAARVPLALLLLAGTLLAVLAHMLDGGDRAPLDRRDDRR